MLIPYAAPAELFQSEMEIKKSIFITHIIPITSEEEALARLGELRKTYKDATHNCFAWRIGTERVLEKSSDDGEPQGTAGHPMLHVLQMKELTNVLAVVTRYFGGIKLGAGGLTRAYSGALAEAVKAAPIVTYTPYEKYILTLPYTAIGGFENYVKDKDIRVLERSFAADVTITFLTLPREAKTHLQFFTDLTGGKAESESVGEEYVKV